MEGGKKQPSSSSCLFNELFGPKDSLAPSSQGILASIFPPPPKAPRGEPLRLSETENKTDSVTQPWTAHKPLSGEEEQSWNTKEKTNSYFLEEKPQPFHYSSSIFYGGQDDYSRPKKPASTTYNKDMSDDDSGSASRGNWWQGSLYY